LRRLNCSRRFDPIMTGQSAPETIARVKHQGGCHCGLVRFEVSAPADIEATECNCSMCGKTGFLHLIVSKSCFQLVRGAEHLSTYTFNTGIAKHFFCRVCGVKSFYVPRSNPDGYSINVRCLDPATITSVKISQFDGQNWEQHGPELSRLSME
jgi:hypothetical protein